MNDLESVLLTSKRVKFKNLKVGDRVLRGSRSKIHYKTVVSIVDKSNDPNINSWTRRMRPTAAILDDGSELSLWSETDLFITRITGEIPDTLFTDCMTTEVIPYLEMAYQSLRNLQATGMIAANDPKHLNKVKELWSIINRFQKEVNNEVKKFRSNS